MNRLVCIAALCLMTGSPVLRPALAQVSETPAAAPERWNGTVTLPNGQKLEFSIALTGTAGTIDIPMQGATGLALADITNDGKSLTFTLKVGATEASWAKFEGAVEEGGQTASGQLHQAGMDMPLKMTKAKPGEAAPTLKRTQEPKPPFPYDSREVSYTNETDGTKLAGTLTFPKGGGQFPAVLLITGSGAQDRNESLLGHKPFLVLADHLSRHGIAVLRVDDRGIGGSTGSVSASTSADFAGDVLAGVEFLSHQPEIDPKLIGLIGHSEGGLIAPMAAVRSDKVAFIVLMAGTGLPGREIIKLQSELIARAGGDTESEAKTDAADQDEIFDLVAKGADDAAIKARIREVAERQIAAREKSAKTADQEKAKAAKGGLDALVEQQTKELTSRWFRYFLTYDPRESLRKVKCPVLAINGAKDLQVPAVANLREIEKALTQAGNTDFGTREMPDLNHLFQKCTTGSPTEYATIEGTIDPAALDLMTAWLRQHAHLPAETPATN